MVGWTEYLFGHLVNQVSQVLGAAMILFGCDDLK
jgi:hypothetical protein